MKIRPARSCAVALAFLLGASSLVGFAAPAQAAPVIESAFHRGYQRALGDTNVCNRTNPALAPLPNSGIWAMNPNSTVTKRLQGAGNYTSQADNSDRHRTDFDYTSSTTLTTANGLPTTASLKYSGTLNSTTDKAESACLVDLSARSSMDFMVNLDRPVWADLTMTNTGPGSATFNVVRQGASSFQASTVSTGTGTTQRSPVYLAPGKYLIVVSGELSVMAKTTFVRTASGQVTVTFAEAGARTAAPTGAAKSYVGLPAQRDCAANTAVSTVIAKKAALKKVRSIVVAANNRKATLKGSTLTTGRKVTLAVPTTSPAKVTATVTLKSGKKLTATASYRACSG